MANRSFIVPTCLALISMTTLSMAQSFFTPRLGQPTKPIELELPPVSSHIISPSDFNNQVSQITDQKHASFKKQLEQQLAQQPVSSPRRSPVRPARVGQSSAPVRTRSTAPPAPTRQDVYTGFGGGSEATTSPEEESPQGSGGWNIRY